MSQRYAWMFVMLMGCGSDGPSVDGSWTGSWMSGGVSGTVVFDLDQSDHDVTGSATFTGSACFTGGGVTGTVHDDEFFGSVTAGGLRLDFDSTITNDGIDGTMSAISAGACSGGTGSFMARH